MEEYAFCGKKDCGACISIQQRDYMFSRKAAVARLSRLVDERMTSPNLKPPVITEAFDWEYQEWADNELSMKGEPA